MCRLEVDVLKRPLHRPRHMGQRPAPREHSVVNETAGSLISCISHSYQSQTPGQSEPALDSAKQQQCSTQVVAVRGTREGFREEAMPGLGMEG